MEISRLNRIIIRAIVKKAINNIQECPKREIRNLIDMGSMFARGKLQKTFFEAAENELRKKDSLYYKIATNIVQKTDSENLLTFGMNLGFNSLTYGAKKIRDFENEAGFNVPWVFLLEISEYGLLGSEEIDMLVSQGKDLGIFSYIFIVKQGYSKAANLAKVIMKHDDCAFILLAQPDFITDSVRSVSLNSVKNIMIGLDITDDTDNKISEATILLRDNKLLCSAFYWAGKEEKVEIETAAKRAADLGYDLVFILQEYSAYINDQFEQCKTVSEIRSHLDVPSVPFDLLSDIVMVDRNISTEGCLPIVSENGETHFTNMETLDQEISFNVTQTPLAEILGAALKKRAS